MCGMKLLVVARKHLCLCIRDILQSNCIVETAFLYKTGEEKIIENGYSLILIQSSLYDGDGKDLASFSKKYNPHASTLLLVNTEDRKNILKKDTTCIDDFLYEPFDLGELQLRVYSLLQSSKNTLQQKTLRFDDIIIDVANRQVKKNNKEIKLSQKEFDILCIMFQHRNSVLRRDFIFSHVWKSDSTAFSNTVDVHVNRLRKKIDKPFNTNHIQTVRGFGYKLVE